MFSLPKVIGEKSNADAHIGTIPALASLLLVYLAEFAYSRMWIYRCHSVRDLIREVHLNATLRKQQVLELGT